MVKNIYGCSRYQRKQLNVDDKLTTRDKKLMSNYNRALYRIQSASYLEDLSNKFSICFETEKDYRAREIILYVGGTKILSFGFDDWETWCYNNVLYVSSADNLGDGKRIDPIGAITTNINNNVSNWIDKNPKEVNLCVTEYKIKMLGL
jgi:hypothetical protein